MQRAVGALLAAAALALSGAPAALAAPPIVHLTRLSGQVSGVLATPQPGVGVTVALERNHRDSGGRLLGHTPVAVAHATTDATGAWTAALARPWGADPRDEVVVHADGGPADVDIAALHADGTRELGLVPSSVLWAADGSSVTVDCGDTDAGAAGSCQSVSAAVVGRPGVISGIRAGASVRAWQLAFSAPVGVDDQVSVTEERAIADVSGQPVRLLLSRDLGVPRGGDATVQRVAGVAPYCAVNLNTGHLRCYELDAAYGYATTSGVGLSYRPDSGTFDADLPSVAPGQQIGVERTGTDRVLTVLHVADRTGAGCDPGSWLGEGGPQDLDSTQICPSNGVMSGADVADAEFDEASGGWTEGSLPGPTPAPASSSSGALVDETPQSFVVGSPSQSNAQDAVANQSLAGVAGGLVTGTNLILGDNADTGPVTAAPASDESGALPAPAPRAFDQCAAQACVVTLRSSTLHAVLSLRRDGDSVTGTGVFGARYGPRTLRGVGRVVDGTGDSVRLLTADGTTLQITPAGAYALDRSGRTVDGHTTLSVRRAGTADAYARSLADRLQAALRRHATATAVIDGPTEERVTITFGRSGRPRVTRTAVAGPGAHRRLRVRRPPASTSITVTITDALGNRTRVSRRV